MLYKITYLTVKPSTGHNRYGVGFWLNKESIPPEYLAERIVEYEGKPFDEDWNSIVTEDIVEWETVCTQ